MGLLLQGSLVLTAPFEGLWPLVTTTGEVCGSASFLRFIFLVFDYTKCVSLCGYVQMNAGAPGVQRHRIPRALEFKVAVSCNTWVPGTELWPSFEN